MNRADFFRTVPWPCYQSLWIQPSVCEQCKHQMSVTHTAFITELLRAPIESQAPPLHIRVASSQALRVLVLLDFMISNVNMAELIYRGRRSLCARLREAEHLLGLFLYLHVIGPNLLIAKIVIAQPCLNFNRLATRRLLPLDSQILLSSLLILAVLLSLLLSFAIISTLVSL